MDNLNVDFKLVNQKVQFTAVSSTNPGRPVTMDYVPPGNEVMTGYGRKTHCSLRNELRNMR
ncbi:MAG: hypothetical protein XD78_0719 [Desulfotomaculum sp. 46_296]|nr:MAG: hypothetical protein XD78_0719 [Desulfotomaculum sp. 46_296]